MKVKLLSPPWRSVTQSCSTRRDESDSSDCVTCSANALANHMTCTTLAAAHALAWRPFPLEYKASNTYGMSRDTCEPSPRRRRI
jgi:hypothetical protein